MPIIPWTEIESFNNIRKYTSVFPEVLQDNPSVTYRAKVKLHGNNAGIQVHLDGRVIPQSRTIELSSKNDLDGFAKWVEPLSDRFLNSGCKGYILYGEWCGPGIQSGVAINNISSKVFALFAARPLDPEDDRLIVEPEELEKMISRTDDGSPLQMWGVIVLPWHKDPIIVDWSADDATVGVQAALINELVMAVEQNDPWVESMFGVKGTGEGIVLYPVSRPGYKNYCNFVFKAKGEAHRVIKTKVAAQVNAEIAKSIDQFVDLVLPDARLNQGAYSVMEGDLRLGPPSFNTRFLGKFLAWIATDVQKEHIDELQASGLEWKQVQKFVTEKARAWYLSQVKK